MFIENSFTTANQKKIKDLKDSEDNMTKLVFTNTFFLVFLRFPETIALLYHIKINSYYTDLSYFYDTNKIIDLFDFLYSLHSTFQFILFFKFNKYFKESAKDIFIKLLLKIANSFFRKNFS